MSCEKKSHYEKRLVAFLDILGFKRHVADSVSNEEVEEKLYRAMRLIQTRRQENEEVVGKKYGDIFGVMTNFSDSIALSYPMKKDKGNLFHLLLDIIYLQMDLFSFGFLLRGGITIGLVYHEGNILYGPAMNEAYYLESERAKYPRIVIESATLDKGIALTRMDGYGNEEELRSKEKEFIDKLVKKDESESLYYLDVLRQGDEMDYPAEAYYKLLSCVRTIVVDGLKNFDDCVHEKYRWLKRYFNDVINSLTLQEVEDKYFFGSGYDSPKKALEAYKSLKI